MNRSNVLPVAAFMVLFVGTACSVKDPAAMNREVSAMGTVNGTSLAARSAVALVDDTFSSNIEKLTVIVSDADNTCSTLETKGTTMLALSFALPYTTAGEDELQPRIFDVSSSRYTAPNRGEVVADFLKVNDSCSSEISKRAGSGTVAITKSYVRTTRKDESFVMGWFDLKFGEDRITGTFSSDYCSDEGGSMAEAILSNSCPDADGEDVDGESDPPEED